MIRVLTREDAGAYRQLRLKALHTDPQAFLATFESEHQKSISYFEFELSSARANPCYGYYGFFVPHNETNEQLIGFCMATGAFLPKQMHVAHLYNLFIDPEFRHQGFGRKLLTHILDILRENNIELVVVSHVRSNTTAHELYLKMGFVQTGMRPHSVKWQGHYDDEVEMVITLK